MVITEFSERNARLYGADTALVEINPFADRDVTVNWHEADLVEAAGDGTPYRRSITWREFDEHANRVANFLLSRNIKRGTKIGMLMMNCLEFLPVYFGILKAGCIVVPMNYRYDAGEIQYCLDLADVEVLVFGPEFTERMDTIANDIPKTGLLLFVGTAGKPDYAEDLLRLVRFCSADLPPVALNEHDDAAIYFSSGTTGFPKAILHAHKALYCSCLTENKHHSQTKDDVFLCIPPLYHTGAKMHWFGSLMVGGRTVLLRGIKPKWIVRTIAREQCTIAWLLVPWAQDILDEIESGELDISHYKLDQWRLMHIGAQPVPPSLIRRWMQVFPHHQYDTNYGLSESIGPGCVHLGVDNIRKVGAIGKAGYMWKTKILDEHQNPVPQGEVGELAVMGPGVMKCYYKNEQASHEILKDNWLLTGDMAREDEDGFIYLVDRKKDVIITGGENLYPVQIEDFLRRNDKIKDVAVIGMPDKRLGEIAAAIIELKEGLTATEEEIGEFCNDLPRYKRPKKIIFAKVPRNPTGKIEKPLLRKTYCGESIVAKQVEI